MSDWDLREQIPCLPEQTERRKGQEARLRTVLRSNDSQGRVLSQLFNGSQWMGLISLFSLCIALSGFAFSSLSSVAIAVDSSSF